MATLVRPERAGAVDEHPPAGRGRVAHDGVERHREGVGQDGGLVRRCRRGPGMSMESCAASSSAQAPGAPVMTPTWTPGPRSPLVKLQHRLRSPAWHGGHGGSMPRGPQVSHGLRTTR